MNDQNQISSYVFFKKAGLTVKQTPPEKAFYAGVSILIALLCILIATGIYLRSKTIIVPAYNTTLSIGTIEQPRYFTPLYASQDTEKIISGLLYAGLYKKTSDSTYVYDLANNITKSGTGTEIDITLRDDISFANGDPITADDVIFTYKLLSDPQVRSVDKVRYEGLEFEKVSDTNFIIHLKKPFPFVEELLTAGILSQKEYADKSLDNFVISELNQDSVSSGMYEVNSKTLDNGGKLEKLELVSNANYKGKRPYIKYIDIYYYTSKSNLSKAFNNKDIDIIFDADTEIKNAITKKNYLESVYTLPRIVAIFLNGNKKDSFAKKYNREEIYEAVNRNAFLDLGFPTYDMLPSSERLATSSVTEYSTSTFTLTLPDMDRRIDVATKIKDMLLTKGITVNLDVKDQTELNQNIIRNRDYEAILGTIEIQNSSDLYAFWHSSQRNAPGLNISSYTSKTFDSNLENIKTATNSANIQTYLDALRDEFYSEYPYIPLYTPTRQVIYRDNLKAVFPKHTSTSKDLITDIDNWYNGTEKVWSIFNKENIINKIYTLLH
jgi:peptide/nickel transport system substrate-binding protein